MVTVYLFDALAIAGAALLVAAGFHVHPAAGYGVAGGLSLAAAIFGHRNTTHATPRRDPRPAVDREPLDAAQ